MENGQRAEENQVSSVSSSWVRWVQPHFGHFSGIFLSFTAAYFQSKGDPITDLTEDMAAEQKARTTYDNILALVDDEEIKKPIRFLRAREVVHYQRFAEALELVKKRLNSKNYYAFNPSFKNGKCNK